MKRIKEKNSIKSEINTLIIKTNNHYHKKQSHYVKQHLTKANITRRRFSFKNTRHNEADNKRNAYLKRKEKKRETHSFIKT